MAHLSLEFFGQFQVTLDGRPLTVFESDKVRALLCYLAVETPGVAYSRHALATLLWPDYGEESARTSLRQALYHLRKTLGDDSQQADSAPGFLLVTRQSIQFNPAADCVVDVRSFAALLAACATHPHEQLNRCPTCLHRLRQAADLYRGDFLAGFAVNDSGPFEEWRRIKQEQWHLQVLDVLTHLANAAEAAGDYAQARQDAMRQLALEPWREEAHRQLMRILAQNGQRTAALTQYQTCRQLLLEELGVEPDATTTALYEQLRAGKPAWAQEKINAPPPPPVSFSQTASLPIQLTPFIGREDELSEITNRLQQPDVRLFTLVGLGGMGKTRLALEAARLRQAAFADGVFFVALASLHDAAAIAPAILTALGVNLHGDDPKHALLDFLRDKQLLLILDNFEHLLDNVGIVTAILLGARQVQILATSRTRLNVRGEHLYMVQGMAYALNVPMATAAHAAAVRLFVQTARRVQATFRLSEENVTAVLRICQLVQGLPLGLELAAVWMELLPLEEIAQELEKGIDFLAAEWHDAPERQRSLRAVFDGSWQMLSASERQVFRQLAVFRGGFTREAAQTVAGGSLRVLASLVHKSLLTVKNWGSRYEMHELLRQFAAEQLDASPAERAAAAARHSEFYLAFVAKREWRLARNEPKEAVAEITLEIDNIRQAWAWAAQQANHTSLGQSAYGLMLFYLFAGLWTEGKQAFALATARLQAQLEEQALRPMVGDPAQPDEGTCARRRVLSKLLGIYAAVLNFLDQYDQAIPVAQQAIVLGQASGEPVGEAGGHLLWGEALGYQGQIQAARLHLAQALELTQRDQPGQPMSEILYDIQWLALVWLRRVCTLLGALVSAQAYMTQGLQICQTLGKLRGEMSCLSNLAAMAHEMNDYPTARGYCEQALALARKLGYQWGEGVAQNELGVIVHRQGDYGLAQDLFQGALAIFRKLGDRKYEALALTHVGRLATHLGDYSQAAALLTQALRLSRTVGARAPELDGLLALALLAHHTGDAQQALTYAEEGWQVARQWAGPYEQAYALVLIGNAWADLQQPTAAATAYRQALVHDERQDNIHLRSALRAGLAQSALRQGAWTQAQALVDELLTILATHPLAGLDEPFALYLTCYHVLVANRDSRAAEVLQTAHALLHQYANRIPDETLRRSFLENVQVHRELREAYAGTVDSRRWTVDGRQ